MASRALHTRPTLHTLRALSPSRRTTPALNNYHTYAEPDPAPYRDPETTILSNALRHVPLQGFSPQALALGAQEAGYLSISTNLFPRGAFELVRFHLVTQRLALKDRVQFPSADQGGQQMGTGRKVKSLVMARLRANVETGITLRWQEALGIMSLAENLGASMKELAALADEIWFLAGDQAVDVSWYTKRASLAGIYAATEVFHTTDQSTELRDTEAFLERRLEENRVLGSVVGETARWVGFQGGAVVNLLRSKGVRI